MTQEELLGEPVPRAEEDMERRAQAEFEARATGRLADITKFEGGPVRCQGTVRKWADRWFCKRPALWMTPTGSAYCVHHLKQDADYTGGAWADWCPPFEFKEET